MEFEWDDAKNEANLKKHKLRFETAIAIFNDIVLTRTDDREDYGEVREISVGMIEGTVVIVVVHTDRDGTLRIISARPANRSERKLYYDYRAKITQ